MIGIYKIVSPSGKVYIGQSVNIEERLQKYRTSKCANQAKLYNSIKKYGWKKHVFSVITECNKEDLNDLEKYFVSVYNSFDTKHGMNLKQGGGSKGHLSDETKKKLSDYYKLNPERLEKCREHARRTLVPYTKKHGVWSTGTGTYYPRPNGNKGANNRAAKLSENQILSIRSEYSKELGNSRSISEKYGVSQTLVTRIVSRAIWKHI